MFLNNQEDWDIVFRQGLLEDDTFFDFTMAPLLKKSKKIKVKIIAKQNGIWAGSHALHSFKKIAEENNFHVKISKVKKEGAFLKNLETVAHLEGEAAVLLAYERTFLNIISYTCGIATQVNDFIKIIEKSSVKPQPRLTATRKTLPFYKKLSLYSVFIAGGKIHRASLSSGVLIKENHIHAYGGIQKAISLLKESSPHLLKIEVEVRNLEELEEALKAKADVVMLDNFSPEEVKRALNYLEKIKHRPIVEVSGGVNKNNLSSYLLKGVDIISIGSLTHSVQGFDFSLLYLK